MTAAATSTLNDHVADERSTKPAARSRLAALAPIVIVGTGFLVTVLTVIALRTPLGHDEAVYMLRSRDIANLGWDTTAGEYWLDYRASGGPIMLMLLGEVIGLHVTTSRALVAVLATVVVVLTWAIGRRFGDTTIGLVGAVLLSVTTGFVATSSTVLADVPGAAFSIAAVWLFGREAQRGQLRYAMFLVPVLTLFACTSRFGSPFMLGAGFIGVSIALMPEVVRRRDWVLAAQSVVLGIVVAIVSWIVLFTELVSIRGRTPVEANTALIEGKHLTPATGLRDLVAVVYPWSDSSARLWSAPVALIMLVGVIAAVAAAVLGRVPRAFVAGMTAAAVLSTAGIVASVGLIVNNYLALTLPYWTLLAGTGLVWLGRSALSMADGDVLRRLALGLAIAAGLFLVIDAGADARRLAASSTTSYEPIRSAAVDLGERFDHRCVVVTSYVSQVGYYSGCIVSTFTSDLTLPLDEMLAQRLDPHREFLERGYQPVVFVVDRGKRQPPSEALESPAVSQERWFEYSVGDGARETAWVHLIEPCVLASNC